MPRLSRRQAIVAVVAGAGYLNGTVVPTAQGQPAMFLNFDGVAVVVVRYAGRQVTLNPHEILDALGAPPPPSYQQKR